MNSEIASTVTYPCPRCKTELQADPEGWQGWLRCPICGVPSPPPKRPVRLSVRIRRKSGTEAGALTATMDEPDGVPSANRVQLAEPPSHTNPLRLIFLTGLTLSVFLLLIAYIDQNRQTTAIFGFLSIVFFVLLLRTPRNRPARPD